MDFQRYLPETAYFRREMPRHLRIANCVHCLYSHYDPFTGRWLSKDPLLFGGGDTNLYGYSMNDPINFTDHTGLLVDDQTGGQIPPEIVNSPIYRDVNSLPINVSIGLNTAINAAGVTSLLGGQSQRIQINPNNQLSSYDLLDTYVHELNHALLNFDFQGRTGEFFDTNLLLPGQINRNLGRPGQCSN